MNHAGLNTELASVMMVEVMMVMMLTRRRKKAEDYLR
jgi:hypothetical protein